MALRQELDEKVKLPCGGHVSFHVHNGKEVRVGAKFTHEMTTGRGAKQVTLCREYETRCNVEIEGDKLSVSDVYVRSSGVGKPEKTSKEMALGVVIPAVRSWLKKHRVKLALYDADRIESDLAWKMRSQRSDERSIIERAKEIEAARRELAKLAASSPKVKEYLDKRERERAKEAREERGRPRLRAARPARPR